jgi:hypothetical protein
MSPRQVRYVEDARLDYPWKDETRYPHRSVDQFTAVFLLSRKVAKSVGSGESHLLKFPDVYLLPKHPRGARLMRRRLCSLGHMTFLAPSRKLAAKEMVLEIAARQPQGDCKGYRMPSF